MIDLNPISFGLRGPPLAELMIAPKRIYKLIWNLFTYIIDQKQKFWRRKNPIFLTHPPLEGGTKKMKILKIGRRA